MSGPSTHPEEPCSRREREQRRRLSGQFKLNTEKMDEALRRLKKLGDDTQQRISQRPPGRKNGAG